MAKWVQGKIIGREGQRDVKMRDQEVFAQMREF